MVRCPFCNHLLEDNAKRCEFCGESLETTCQYCKETISVYDRICPYCDSKLRTNSISILTNVTYFLLFINPLITCWFANSISNHPVFWHKFMMEKDSFEDLTSAVISLAVISSIPSIISIISNYRKRVSTISIIFILLLCICNIYLITQIH